MSEKILNGRKIAKKIKIEIKKEVDLLLKNNIFPRLDVVLVGSDPASEIYVKHKQKDCGEVGIISKLHRVDKEVSEKDLINLIEKLNTNGEVSGILVQLPLPKHLNEEYILNTILPKKDVDGFSDINMGSLVRGTQTLAPCTPSGILHLLNAYNIEIEGKVAVVIGRSNIVGKPMASMLLNNNATIIICHSKTKNIKEITKTGDIIVCAVGIPMFLTEDMIKKDAVIIDVGINKDINGKLVGDVDFENVKEKVSFISPVPGGVGPMTRAILLKNTLIVAKNKKTR